MGSSLLSSNRVYIVLAGVLFFQPICSNVAAEIPRPFPVLGSMSVEEGHWNGVPELLAKLSDKVTEESIRFQITAGVAEQYFSIGLRDESSGAFQKLLKAKKPSPALFIQQNSTLRLAEIALLQGKADEALKDLEPLQKETNPYMAQEVLFMQARCYLVKQNWKDLNAVVRQLLLQYPAYADDLSINLLRGVAAIEQNRPDEALLFVKKYPDQPAALYYQGVCYIKKKEFSSALPLYQQILQKNSNSEWVDRMRMALGEAFYMAHDIPLAHEFFKPVTRPQADPVLRPLALHRRGCLFFEQKNFAEADKIFIALLKEYPKHPLRSQWTYLYASIPIFQKDWKKAIQEQKMALEFPRGLGPRGQGGDANN